MIEPQAFVSTIAVVGAIVPGDDVEVTSPTQGIVRRVSFEYGAPVAQGQILVALDPSDVEQRRNEARADYLKAAQAWSEMAVWATGPEVSRDRRAAAAAAFDLQDTRRKADGTKTLLDRGLVARDEYEGVLQQLRSQQMALAAARQELAATLSRGRGPGREVAGLDLANARSRLAVLDAELAGAIIRSPAAGVIVRPPADKADAPPQIHAGLQLAKGQLIGSIARAGGLAVSFHLSETDADAVRPGQAVSVTGPGFAGFSVRGHVVSVAGEASPASATGSPSATFAGTARLDGLTLGQARALRIGMTANVVVETYRNKAALVVPPAAVKGAAADAFVEVRDSGSGRIRSIRVGLGHTAPDGVEILSGLKAGETVVWPNPRSDQPSPLPPS